MFDSLDTTMREAAERARAGAPEGTLIVADRQTAGRGRHGRSWASEPGVGLYFSLVLRPRRPAPQMLALTLAAGVGLARGIGEFCGLTCDIRWPNDVMLEGRKLAGILVEAETENGVLERAILGVGVNVNQERMPAEIAPIAISLREATGAEYVREALLETILGRLEQAYVMLLESGPEAVLAAFRRISTWTQGKGVAVEGLERPMSGVTAGLSPEGWLLLRDETGAVRPILAGSVRPLD